MAMHHDHGEKGEEGSFSDKCIVLTFDVEKCMIILLFSVLFAMTYIHVN